MIRVALLRRRLLSASAMASVLSLAPVVAGAAALPTQGHYVSGQGSIAKGSQSLTVKQSSTTGIIDWNSFSVGKGNGVSFNNGSGATLNRVTGSNLSSIAGSLHATGSLYIMNSAGVIVSGTGHIVTGGSFVATSGNIGSAFDTDERFRAGAGKIINKGSIVAGASATLAGSDVRDSGSIRASSVDLSATHRLGITGSIAAQNGDGSGGAIIATGRSIAVGGSASINASGTKGGTVLIGGDVHGGAIASDNFVQQTVRTASTTTIAAGAHITADGSKTSGGNIVIWSDGHTTFGGAISAKGQTAGGFAEVSSHDLLGFTGKVDLTSTAGKTGTLLLDPENVTIEDGTTANGTLASGTYTTTGDNSILSVADLEAALATANVLVQTGSSNGSQSGDITVLSPITWSSGSTLTLDAYRNINIDSAITITGAGGLSLIYGDQAQNQTGNSADGSLNIFGNVAFTDVVSNTTLGSLTINGAGYVLVNSISQLNQHTGDNVAIADGIDASGTTYSSSPLSHFTGTLEGLGNAISNLTITSVQQYTGLIGENDGTVRDLGLVNAAVSTRWAATAYVGALTGYNDGTIENDYATGTVTDTAGFNDVGGLVGFDIGGTVEGSHAAVIVTGGEDDSDGGLVGLTAQRNGSINSLIETSYATGAVSGGGSAYVGGLVGTNGGGEIETSYATGAVTGTGDTGYLGGLAGRNESGAEIYTSYATGNVSNTNQDGYLGGLVGDNQGGTILATYAMGNVSGGSGSYAGGLAGFNSSAGLIDESYELGAVTGSGTTGGFVGDNLNSNMGTTFADYFNSSANASASGSGADQAGTTVGATFSNLEKASTFTNWHFGDLGSGQTWVIVDQNGSLNGSNGGTTPMLLSEYSTTITNAHQLQLMELDPTANYTLANDIDACGTGSSNDVWGSQGFIPVGGNGASNFSGTFNGLGNIISNLFIDSTFNIVGLFGEINGGTVNDLGVVNANVTGGSVATGVLAGSLVATSSASLVFNSYATGSVEGNSEVGGLVGLLGNNNEVLQSYADVSVSGNAPFAGGLVGINNGLIKQSYANGSVAASGYAGGLASENTGSIVQSYATGSALGGLSSGGLVGQEDNAGGISNSYWDTDTGVSDATKGAGNISNDSGITGLTTAQLTAALPGGFDPSIWGNVNNQTTPYLLALTSNPQTVYVGDGHEGTFSLLFNMTQVQAINNNLTGNYALANSIDASSVTSWTPLGTDGAGDIWDGTGFGPSRNNLPGFSGIFDGLGNTISNLTINSPNAAFVGLFGWSTGTVRNIGMIGGSVTGEQEVGALVGFNFGTVSGAYETGAIIGGEDLGGLVGDNEGNISNSYANGSVTGDNDQAGGLVGQNDGDITNAYATGAVSEIHGASGGLVGEMGNGTITNAYATGTVNGEIVGGLVSVLDSGTITHGYYDSETTGQAHGAQADGSIGLTTAELTAALPTGFGSGVWGNVNNQTTPYLLALTSNPQTVYVGDGHEGTFSLLFNMTQVQAINNNLTGNYALANSIDASSVTSWTPLGTDGAGDIWDGTGFGPSRNNLPGFSGIFDGLGNTISNLSINLPNSAFVGLFGWSTGTVRNVGMVGGTVTGEQEVGDLVGTNFGTVTGAYATGTMNSTQGAGGLVGDNEGSISNSYASGSVTVNSDDAGGLVGDNEGSISNSYASGSVSETLGDAGGLVGGLDGGTITNSYATGNASGEVAGGLVGVFTSGTITNSYATGAASGTSSFGGAGGLVGYVYGGTITNAYATGAVNGPHVGGLVGNILNAVTITNGYYNSETTGQAHGAQTDGSIGLTTAELTAALPTGFDNTVWGNVNNQTTPYLLALTGNPQTVYLGSDSTDKFSLLFNMAQMQAINNNLSGNYALANSLDASSVTNWSPIEQGVNNGFTGIFDGLGNAISNLTINDATDINVGLFGTVSGGTITKIGLVNVNVISPQSGDVGALVGSLENGEVTQSYATGRVSGSGIQDTLGGLIGYNAGMVTQSYALDSVSAGRFSEAGGLIGQNDGSVAQSYATGQVSAGGGQSAVGGLIGADSSGTVTASYFDTETSGFSASQGVGSGSANGISGLTTAALTAALPTGFDSSVWGNVNNQTTPYLLSLTGNPQTVYVGDGHEGTFSLLFNMAQVQATNNNLSGNYALADSLDASSVTSWTPIGDSSSGGSGSSFTGLFNGLGNTISNLTINDAQDWYVGLFAVNGGTISNLALSNVSVSVTGNPNSLTGLEVGGLSGGNYGTVENVSVSGTVSVSNMTIVPDGVGGLIGASISGNITSSSSSASVSLAGLGTSDFHAGGLLGLNTSGLVSDSFSTGSVVVDAKEATAGGLVGLNDGTISQSWSSGAVNAISTGSGSGSVSDAGGLVGSNYSSISQSYAIGSVSATGGAAQIAGGLVGGDEGTITQSYAIGMVTGGSAATLGGLVGDDLSNSGSITHSYFDTETSGIDAAQGAGNVSNDAGITGATTAALQSASILSSLGGSTVWGIVADESFPYLKWQGTPQFITGTIYSDGGATNVGGAQTVSLYSDGALFGTATTYANGYYYVMLSPGTFTGNLLGTAASVSTGNTVGTNVNGSVFNANIYGNTEDLITADTSMSGAMTDLASAYGSLTGSAYLYDTGTSSLDSNIDLNVTANGANFAIDTLPGVGSSNTLTLDTSGNVTQSVAIAAASLVLEGNGDFLLTDTGNHFTKLSGSVGSSEVYDGAAMTVDALSSTGDLTLATGSGAHIAIDGAVVANDTLTLDAGGAITETGTITAHTLTGSSVGGTNLLSDNMIASLGSFTNVGHGYFRLDDGESLKVTGAVDAGINELKLKTTGSGHGITIKSTLTTMGRVKLVSGGKITQSGAGAIDAYALTGSSAGAVTLTGDNELRWIEAFTAGGNFALTDDSDLEVHGIVDAGSHSIALTTTGTDQDIRIAQGLTGSTVSLNATGEALETATGAITANRLNVRAGTGIKLTSPNNKITKLGTDKTTTGPNKVTL